MLLLPVVIAEGVDGILRDGGADRDVLAAVARDERLIARPAGEGVVVRRVKGESTAVVGIDEDPAVLVRDGTGVTSVDSLTEIAGAEALGDLVLTGALAGVGIRDRERDFVNEAAKIVLFNDPAVLGFAEVVDGVESCLAVLIVPFDASRIRWVAIRFEVGFGVDHVAV